MILEKQDFTNKKKSSKSWYKDLLLTSNSVIPETNKIALM